MGPSGPQEGGQAVISGQYVTAPALEALGARLLAAPGHLRGGEQLSAWGNLGLGHSCLGCLPWLCPSGRGLHTWCIPPKGRIHADRAEHIHKRRLLRGVPSCPSSRGKVALAEYRALDSDLGKATQRAGGNQFSSPLLPGATDQMKAKYACTGVGARGPAVAERLLGDSAGRWWGHGPGPPAVVPGVPTSGRHSGSPSGAPAGGSQR